MGSFVNFGLKMKICIMWKCSPGAFRGRGAIPEPPFQECPGAFHARGMLPRSVPRPRTDLEHPFQECPGAFHARGMPPPGAVHGRGTEPPFVNFVKKHELRPAEIGQGDYFKEFGTPRRYFPNCRMQI